MTTLFEGLFVALATPFQQDGSVDLPAFARLTTHVVKGGADGVVVLGSTGEAATVLPEERRELIRVGLEVAKGRTVLVGTGHNSTACAVAMTREAQTLGAQGALVVTPYYNKPTPQGLVAHYRAIAEAAPGFPLMAYNVPGRTGLNVTPAVMNRLWDIPEVVALKESSGNLRQLEDMLRVLPPGKGILCGDDDVALPALAVGACGLVSVMGNLVPEMTAALVRAARCGAWTQARSLQMDLLPLIEALFLESNPVPLKAGLPLLGLGQDVLRLPLVSAQPETRARVQAAMAALLGVVA